MEGRYTSKLIERRKRACKRNKESNQQNTTRQTKKEKWALIFDSEISIFCIDSKEVSSIYIQIVIIIPIDFVRLNTPFLFRKFVPLAFGRPSKAPQWIAKICPCSVTALGQWGPTWGKRYRGHSSRRIPRRHDARREWSHEPTWYVFGS